MSLMNYFLIMGFQLLLFTFYLFVLNDLGSDVAERYSDKLSLDQNLIHFFSTDLAKSFQMGKTPQLHSL